MGLLSRHPVAYARGSETKVLPNRDRKGVGAFLPRRQRLQIPVIKFHAVIKRTDPQTFIFAVRANIIVIDRNP
jgi:hypothetical protein